MFESLTGGNFSQIFILLQVLSFILFFVMIFAGPRLLLWQGNRKMNSALDEIKAFHHDTEEYFLEDMEPLENFQSRYRSMKNFQVSQPENLDPAGMVGKLENVLDASENRFKSFVEKHSEVEGEELENQTMAFKGVLGTHQMQKVVKHFQELFNKTGNIQIYSMINMMLPLYQELAESQKGATRAFANGDPTGDGIGPLVAAKLISDEPEEIAEDIVHSEEEINDTEIHVLKSKGPGARLGKYGDALNELEGLDAVITVDAASKLESEDTGTVNEGVGVMMGGPGVEKTKIEEYAAEHDIPLEGVVIKQSAPEASKPMKEPIYKAWKEARDRTLQLAEDHDKVAVLGVGNTCGVGNTREDTQGIHNKLRKYWEEYEEQEETVSYTGLMPLFGSPDQSKVDELTWSLLR